MRIYELVRMQRMDTNKLLNEYLAEFKINMPKDEVAVWEDK